MADRKGLAPGVDGCLFLRRMRFSSAARRCFSSDLARPFRTSHLQRTLSEANSCQLPWSMSVSFISLLHTSEKRRCSGPWAVVPVASRHRIVSPLRSFHLALAWVDMSKPAKSVLLKKGEGSVILPWSGLQCWQLGLTTRC